MAIRLSTEFRNKISEGYGVREIMRDSRIYVYTGAQPATADSAESGTLLATFTLSGGTYTASTASTAVLVISGSTGSLDTVKVGGALDLLNGTPVVITSGALGTSADNIAAAINGFQNALNITAVSDSVDTITLSCPKWLGADVNDLGCATTQTTSTVTVNGGSSAAFGGTGATAGVSAVNGLNMVFPAVLGVLSKEATVWQDSSPGNTGTAGWFRMVPGDSTYTGASVSDVRIDGNVSTSGADLNMTSTAIVAAAVQTISTFTITFPAS